MRPTYGLLTLLACTAPPPDAPEPEPATVFHAAPVGPPPLAPAAPPPGPSRVEWDHVCPEGPIGNPPERPLDGPPERFDPDGRYGGNLARRESECEVWELDGRVFVGSFWRPLGAAKCSSWPGNVDPCSVWPKLEQLERQIPGTVDKRLVVDELELVIEGGRVNALGAGEVRYSFRSGADDYAGAWLSRDRDRLALLRDGAIELREVDTGALLGGLSLLDPAPPSHTLESLYLMWTPEGMPVAVLEWEACDEPEREWCRSSWVWEVRTWASPSAAAEVKAVSFAELSTGASDATATVEQATADPHGRWLYLYLSEGSGDDQPAGVWQIRLSPEAAPEAEQR